MMAGEVPPPRKSVSAPCKPGLHRNASQSSLQILLQMGFPKHRAEKALAATGYRGAQLAADWLLAHVNDPTLDDNNQREYILYLCPSGPLLEQLQSFYSNSLVKCGWNGAHNYLPHITLCSFFQAPDDAVGLLVNALQHCVEKLKTDLPSNLKLDSYVSQQFVGLFVNEEQNDVLKRLAMMFMRECSEFISGDLGPMHVISTCFPWCSSYPVLNPKRIEVEPYLKSLHITLAYQFEPSSKDLLEPLLKEIDASSDCSWELRLYSRDQRIKGHEVHRIRFSYAPQQQDELELLIGDYVYINGDSLKSSTDGWVEGVSWLTGCSGQLPISYIQRAAESDAWTLHKCIFLNGEGNSSDEDTRECSQWMNRRLPNNGLKEASVNSEHIVSSQLDTSSDIESNTFPSEGEPEPSANSLRQLYVIRHAERIDFTFGNWIPVCFDSGGDYQRRDLNQPKSVPRRANTQEYFKDSPLTIIGLYQATLTGRALNEANVTFSGVYCSPSYRCVQTCTNILKELNIASKVAINIEPGLFEWLAWHQEHVPSWMTPNQLFENGFNINLEYKPLISVNELWSKKTETSEQYYMRSFFVASSVLNSTPGNVLFVGHAASLDTCTRQLLGKTPRTDLELVHMVQKIPYCGVSVTEESADKQWTLVKPAILTLQHSDNLRYDWKQLKTEKDKGDELS